MTMDLPDRPTDTRPVVLFVHGATLTHAMWTLATDRFAPRYRCVTPDLPGHGLRSGQPFRMRDGIDALRAATEGLSRFSIVGESLGGYTAMAFAAEAGPRVASIVISGASSNFQGLAYVPWWLQKSTAHVLEALLGPERLYRLIIEKLERTLPPRLARAVAASGLRLEAFDEAVAELRQRDFLHDVARIDAPILFVNGSRDRRQCRQEPRFVAAAKQATTHRFAGAPHGVSLWHAERLASVAYDFIEQHAAVRRASTGSPT
jgi:pimeloyl-ACP methyl ester carboxylesterase